MATPSPTSEAFEKLLSKLNPDRERAGEEYELLRLKLLEYFRSRACQCAEELADETLNRLAKKNMEGEEIRDVLRYTHGLAHWVWMEFLRKPGARPVSFEDLPVAPFVLPTSILQKEREACFHYCLRALPARDRELVVEYWDHRKQTNREARRELAERMQITMIAMRIRISRIKDKLEACFYNCLENGLPKTKRS
jgi:DNA-directed RNA polymerase specialized sigma24 family protein